MNARPWLRRTVCLATLCLLALLLAGPAVSAAPTPPQRNLPPIAAATTIALQRTLGRPTTPDAGPIAPGLLATVGPPAPPPTGAGLHSTHTVTSTADSGPGSLRQALFDANPGDTIGFSLTYPVTITLTSGELAITKSLTIVGPGAESLTVSGNGASRVLAIGGPSTTVALSGLTVANGADSAGGGIVSDGTLMVTHASFSGNYALYFGGGIYNWGPLTVIDATFTDNWAQGGGGIWSARPATLTNVTFSGNWAEGNGGGILNQGSLTVSRAIFSGNTASGDGGGIRNEGTLAVVDATFSGNHAVVYGGGIDNWETLTVTNTTFAGNKADWAGGGLASDAVLTLTNVTFSGNQAATFYGGGVDNEGTLYLRSTIIADSIAGGDCRNSGAIEQNVNNLIEDGSCGPLYSGDPHLGPLGDYGGETWTHPLISPSLAIDHGDPATCPLTDQRGYLRYGPCDIGAFEYNGTPPPPCTPADGADFSWRAITPTVGEAVTFTGTVAAGSEPVTYTWKLDVGSWKEGRVVTHTYGLPGTYAVVMTATNCATATAPAVHTVTVVCPEVSNAGFAWTPPTPVEGEPVTLTAAASSTRPLSYAWDLGDSSFVFGPWVTHTYAAPGAYTVTLTATNDCGAWQAVTGTVIVTPTCHAAGIVSVTTGIAGCEVTFGAEVTGTPPFTYLWDFGPFGTSTATNLLVDFVVSGAYSGTLRVWNCGNAEPAVRALTVGVDCAGKYFIYLPIVVKP